MDGEKIFIVNPKTGERGYVDRSELGTWSAAGFEPESEEATEDARLQEEYGDSPLQAGLEGAARTLTFGASDLALSELDPEGARERRARNSGAALTGELGGALLGAGVGMGGAVTGVGKAAEAGVAEAAGGGLGARVLGGAARGAVEGAAYGAGSGVTQVAELPPDMRTWEGAAATIGSSALGGAVIGGVTGAGAKLLEEGATAAKSAAMRKLEEMRRPDATAAARAEFPDIAAMDKPTAKEALAVEREAVKTQRATELVEGKAAREAELANIEAAKDAAAKELHQEALAFKDHLRDDPSAFIATGDAETATVLKRSKVQIMKGLDNEEGFIQQRGSRQVLDGLQKQKGALNKVLADADAVIAGADAERQAMLDRLPGARLADRDTFYLAPEDAKVWRSLNGIKAAKGETATVLTWDQVQSFRGAIESGVANPPALQRVLNAQALLEKNQALLDKFAAVKAPPSSPALETIDARLEAARAGVAKTPRLTALEAHLADLAEDSMGRKVAKGIGGTLGGTVGSVGGFVGAMVGRDAGAEMGAKVYDRLVKKLAAGNGMRAKSIAASLGLLFASGAQKTAQAAQRVAPLASRILPSISYAPKAYVDGTLGPDNAKPSKTEAVNDFRARARELNAITQREADGTYSMRMPARRELGQRLQGLWAVAPEVANGVEKTHAARVAFLASKLPRDPSPPHLQVGPDTWEPSHAELAKFARYMEAVEYPERCIQRLATSTMTPEDAEVLRTVYPGLYADVQEQCMAHIAELRETLPYSRRLSLSIYFDRPVDPALTPEALSVFQRPPQSAAQQSSGPAPAKAMPTGMAQPTRAQRYST